MDKDEPITDKENFPPSPEGEKLYKFFAPIEQVAFRDGLLEGYRNAVRDLAIYVIVFLTVFFVASKINATN
jgi:hypothetical protein